jgi:hypothetical protein
MVGSCEHGNEPSGSIKAGNFLTIGVTVSFSRRTLLHRINYEVYLEPISISLQGMI